MLYAPMAYQKRVLITLCYVFGVCPISISLDFFHFILYLLYLINESKLNRQIVFIRLMKRIFLSFVLCLAGFPICSQTREIIFNQIQKSDGSLYNVRNLIQDQNGFIWFRTAGNQGIQRYDGYEFISFLDSAGFFNSIMKDKRGLLWLGTSSGITLFNPENEKSIHFFPDPGDLKRSYSLNNIAKIIEDNRGNIWCATSDGILKLEPKIEPVHPQLKNNIFIKGIESVFNIKVLKIHKDDTTGGINQISDIYEDSKERIWIGGTECLYIVNPETNDYMRIDDDSYGRSRLSDPFISSIIEENTDVFWVGTGNGLCRLSNIEKAFSETSMNKSLLVFNQYPEIKLIQDLLLDNQNKLWIGTYLNGLVEMQYDENGKPKFKEVYTDLYEPEGEGIKTVFSLMKDRTGLIWAGHQYGGIRKFDPGGNYFTSYDGIIRQYFANYNLNSIIKDDDDNLWIGTFGDGLHKISKGGKVTKYYIIDHGIPDRFGNGVISILKIEKDIFWIGATNGIWQFNIKSGRSLKLFTKTRYGELNDHVYDMQKIENYVLFSLWGEGLFIYDLLTEELRQYKYYQNESLGLRSNVNYSICPISNGEVYIGGSRGLNRLKFNKSTGEITFLSVPLSNALMNTLGTFNKLHEDKEGILWCGTNNGLLKLDIRSGETRMWTSNDGLSFNVIHSIEEDDRGNLWLGTTNGLSTLNTKTGAIKAFNRSNGLPIAIHAHHSSFRDKKGLLYFGGIGGFYSFHPDSIKTNELIPPVAITDFRLFNKPVKINSSRKAVIKTNISYTKKITLAYYQHDLSFTFAVLDYGSPAQNKYAYRLDGYQKEWIETDADNRIATYTNLNPGTYTFMLKGSNSDGIWNVEGKLINIVINPPFWRTKMAYIVYGVLFLLLLRVYIFWRTRRLRKEKIVLEKQVSERTQKILEQKEELLQQKEVLQSTLENLQKTQEQLVESEKMAALGGLVAGVAHEINTPVGIGITAISNLMDEVQKMVELYKKDEISRKDFKEFLQTSYDAGVLIQKNLERTASLIQSFKQLSVDQVSEQQRVFGFRDYLYDILTSLQPKFKQKKIEFKIECDDKLELISFPGVYAQIFTNLLLNSLQHGFHDRERGTIAITVDMDNGLLKILYRDDGTGISKKDLPHIFEPFYTSDQRRGTGLGLNIVYNLIKQKLHGSISCESEQEKGALFLIEVPLI
jgi:signal transduction histidine kinase/ligand-binding sensor domain-containing protein